MPQGGCMCGHVSYAYEGEPQMKALCHCVDCQKIGGSTHSVNVVIKDDGFKWTGQTPKEFGKTADSGKKIVSYFCGDCGSTLARAGDAFPNMIILKAGTIDGGLEMAKPDAELFVKHRASWQPKIGQNEMQTME